MEGLTAIWAEEDAEYAAREHALAKAKTADGEALKAAAIAGEPDPGMKSTDVATRALVYQEERVKAAGRAVSKESLKLFPVPPSDYPQKLPSSKMLFTCLFHATYSFSAIG